MAKKTQTEDTNFSKIESLYKNGGIVNLEDNPRFTQKIDTKRPSLQFVTDGGFPVGRLILISGQESSGKSSLAIQISQIIAESLDKNILYVDTEHTTTTDYIRDLVGGSAKRFNHCMPETTELMCDIIRKEIPKYGVVIIDSINNSSSNERMQKEAGEFTMSNRARVLSEQLPILISLADQHNTTLIVLSQVRENMNKANKYSPDTVVPGGKSLHHNSSLSIEMYPAMKKKEGKADEMELYETISGRMVKIKVVKNKVGKPFRSVELEFTYGLGYTIESDVASSAKRLGILEMAGSWVKYKGTTLVQGIDNLVPMLFDNPELLDDLKLEIAEKTKEKDTTD
jgi:recombination protein RecA